MAATEEAVVESHRIESNRSQRLSAAEAEVAELQRRLADMTRVAEEAKAQAPAPDALLPTHRFPTTAPRHARAQRAVPSFRT